MVVAVRGMRRTAMRRIQGVLREDLVVDDDVLVVGTVVGNIRVEASGNLRLEGTARGHLVILANGAAAIHGTVTGDVLTAGRLFVAGVVRGRVVESAGSITSVGRG